MVLRWTVVHASQNLNWIWLLETINVSGWKTNGQDEKRKWSNEGPGYIGSKIKLISINRLA